MFIIGLNIINKYLWLVWISWINIDDVLEITLYKWFKRKNIWLNLTYAMLIKSGVEKQENSYMLTK